MKQSSLAVYAGSASERQ